MRGGFLTLFNRKGLLVRLHWTAPVGAFVFGLFRIIPGFWLGFLILILIHELGHAAIVRACGARVHTVDLHGAGGQCSWYGTVTPIQRSLIAWGGVLAQLVLLGVVVTFLRVVHPHFEGFMAELVEACVAANLFVIAFNMIPVGNLDGVEAWRLPPLLWRRRRSRRSWARGANRVRVRRKAGAKIVRLEVAGKEERNRSRDR
jgi:hypothetical protein